MITLKTQRLKLRAWTEADSDDLVEGLNNFNISRWLAYVPFPYTQEDAMKWINFCKQNKTINKINRYEFAIELTAERKVVGGVSLTNINPFQRKAEGGIWMNERYHGQGLGTEAFGKRIEFAFEELNLRRLENGFFTGNENSLKMQEKFGYKIEGIKRSSLLCMADNEMKDECITGLLKEEWKK
jgi:ribosomal-protein-alanine N-acetyltransferase